LQHCLIQDKLLHAPQTLEREREREREREMVVIAKRIGIETKFPQLELLAVFRKRKQATAVFCKATNFKKLFFLL
jgi:hypothetical protein